MVLHDARRAIFHNRADQPFASKELQAFVNATMKHILEREREKNANTRHYRFTESVRVVLFVLFDSTVYCAADVISTRSQSPASKER